MSTSKQIAVGRLDPREPAGPRSAGGEAASRANSKLASRRSQIIPGKPNSAKTSFAPQSNQQNWVRSVILPHPGPHSPRARAGPNWVRSAIFPRPGPARPEPVPPAIGVVSAFCSSPAPHSPRARANPRSGSCRHSAPPRTHSPPDPVPPAIGFVPSFWPPWTPTPQARAARARHRNLSARPPRLSHSERPIVEESCRRFSRLTDDKNDRLSYWRELVKIEHCQIISYRSSSLRYLRTGDCGSASKLSPGSPGGILK